MAPVKTASALLVAVLTAGSSTCRGQSGGAADAVAKEPTPTPTEVTLSGVDTSALTSRERREWSSYVGDFLAPCADVPVSIAQCVQEKRACARCLPAAKYILRGVRDGMSREQIEAGYKNRFATDRIRNVALDGSPQKGPEGAPITIVEFADFECPYCGVMAPILDKAEKDREGQIRLVYKFMPLSGHPHGEIAARAAIAALNIGGPGKFWEMHKKLFENQKRLEQSDLEGYAKELSLDVARFRTEMNAPATTDRLQRDRKLADSLEVKGTPTIYINGREYDPHQDLNEWVDQELGLDGAKKPAPSGSASAAASAPSKGAPSPSAPPPSASTKATPSPVGAPVVAPGQAQPPSQKQR